MGWQALHKIECRSIWFVSRSSDDSVSEAPSLEHLSLGQQNCLESTFLISQQSAMSIAFRSLGIPENVLHTPGAQLAKQRIAASELDQEWPPT